MGFARVGMKAEAKTGNSLPLVQRTLLRMAFSSLDADKAVTNQRHLR